MKRVCTASLLSLTVLLTAAADAGELLVSIGIRETGGAGPIGADGGASGGIEWVDLDGQSLSADGTWQLFTFTPATDPLTAFAGDTADGILDVEWATLEHIRFRNTTDGYTAYRVWIDDASNVTSQATATVDFEGVPVGAEFLFRQPSFSGSTAGHLNTSRFNFAGIDDSMAFAGDQSYLVEFEFVDDDPSRWLRLTTFDAPGLPNPAVLVAEPNAATQPSISFYLKAVAIPEPATGVLLILGGAATFVVLRRKV